jgi:hypothetical protein
MNNLLSLPCLYLVLAIIISLYQGYRGYMFQWLYAIEKGSEEEKKPENASKLKWTRNQKIFLLCIADMLLYIISTFLGFLALFLSYRILSEVPDLFDIGGGLTALLIFLIIFGLLGISGQLPNLMQKAELLLMQLRMPLPIWKNK